MGGHGEKPLELPPAMAPGFVSTLRGYFAENDPIKRDAIAAHQLGVLKGYQWPRENKLRLSDVKDTFLAMRDHA